MHGDISFWRNVTRMVAISAFIAVSIVALVYGPGAAAAEISPFDGPPLERTATDWGVGYELQVGDQQFSLSQIEGLPSYQTNIKTPWNAVGTFVGVKLVDLLRHAGTEDFQRLLAHASNDYKVTIAPDDKGLDKALLTYRLNDSLFMLNGKGPYWLIWPQQAEALLNGEEPGTKWIWSVVEIRKIR